LNFFLQLAFFLRQGFGGIVIQVGVRVAQLAADLAQLAHNILARDGGIALVHAHARRGFVNQIDGFIRQEAIGHVTRAELRGGLKRLVADFQAVVFLIFVADAV